MMDMKTLSNLQIDANMALATIGMVSDLFETEADPWLLFTARSSRLRIRWIRHNK